MQKTKEDISIPKEVRQHPAWIRLNDQLEWYDRKSGENQKLYKQIKVAQLVLAGSIPVFALVGDTWGRWITAILGASVAILEGLQQLGQYNWTCVGSVDCFRLRTVRGKESSATNKPHLPTGVSPRSYPPG